MRAKTVLATTMAILLAGCSNGVSGSPTPVNSSNAAEPSDGVPKVAHPLDTTRFEKEPCAALTPSQLAQLAITTQPKPEPQNALGPTCRWNADEAGMNIGGALLTAGSSLAKLYKQHDQGRWPFFEPVPDVVGYPGVLLDGVNAQPKGNCDVSVAVRDDLIYSVQVAIFSGQSDYENPCPVAQKVAEMAISTMKAG